VAVEEPSVVGWLPSELPKSTLRSTGSLTAHPMMTTRVSVKPAVDANEPGLIDFFEDVVDEYQGDQGQ
jgi:hypothetical protein